MTRIASQTAELKKSQEDEDGRFVGRAELQNWGKMLRADAKVGPAGYKPSAIFKNYIPRYRENTYSPPSFDADKAYLTLDLVNWLVKDEMERICLFIYFAEEASALNMQSSLERYNDMFPNDQDKISMTKLQKLLNSAEIRIGTAFLLCESDDSWKEVTRLMAST